MKFVANVDKVWGWGIFTHDVVLASWVVIFVLMAIYVLGLFRFAHEAPVKHVGIARLATSIVCGTIGLWLMTGLHGKPLGELDAFLPPSEAPTTGVATAAASSELPWITNDYGRRSPSPSATGSGSSWTSPATPARTAGGWKSTCSRVPRFASRLAKFVLVRLYTDGEGEIFQQQQLQQAKYKTVALPYYAVENPTAARSQLPGLTRDPASLRLRRRGFVS